MNSTITTATLTALKDSMLTASLVEGYGRDMRLVPTKSPKIFALLLDRSSKYTTGTGHISLASIIDALYVQDDLDFMDSVRMLHWDEQTIRHCLYNRFVLNNTIPMAYWEACNGVYNPTGVFTHQELYARIQGMAYCEVKDSVYIC